VFSFTSDIIKSNEAVFLVLKETSVYLIFLGVYLIQHISVTMETTYLNLPDYHYNPYIGYSRAVYPSYC